MKNSGVDLTRGSRIEYWLKIKKEVTEVNYMLISFSFSPPFSIQRCPTRSNGLESANARCDPKTITRITKAAIKDVNCGVNWDTLFHLTSLVRQFEKIEAKSCGRWWWDVHQIQVKTRGQVWPFVPALFQKLKAAEDDDEMYAYLSYVCFCFFIITVKAILC